MEVIIFEIMQLLQYAQEVEQYTQTLYIDRFGMLPKDYREQVIKNTIYGKYYYSIP